MTAEANGGPASAAPGPAWGADRPAPNHGEPEGGWPTPRTGRVAAWLAKQVELGVAEAGLSVPQFRILSLLDPGPTVPSALADRLAVRPPSVTAVVDGLVARGLVDRRPAEGDRRRVAHALTEEGRRSLASADAAVDARLRHLASALATPAQAASALACLELWGQAMISHAAGRDAGAAGEADRAGAAGGADRAGAASGADRAGAAGEAGDTGPAVPTAGTAG